jgi:hypothetical protein
VPGRGVSILLSPQGEFKGTASRDLFIESDCGVFLPNSPTGLCHLTSVGQKNPL